MISVTNNFLNNDKFFEIKKLLISGKFPYFFTDNVNVLTHKIVEVVDNKRECSLFLEPLISNLCQTLKVNEIIESKVILITKEKDNFCLDINKKNLNEISLNNNSFKSILYINSNDGFTEILGKDKVGSVQNRLLTFSSNVFYQESTPTNTHYRILLELVYTL
jgi:hypothetical protein